MALTNITTKIEVQSLDKVQTLIDLLSENIKKLPENVVTALNELADCDHCEITSGSAEVVRLGFPVKCIVDDSEIGEVISVNKVLKRVKYIEGAETKHSYHTNVKLVGKNGSMVVF